MGFLRFIFAPIVAIFRFINTYFKAILFLLIVFLIEDWLKVIFFLML